ncbi:hypothetical protein GCM10007874_47000 [Labrys miyagiensis]|uniref:Uncharacterized protein n=1 Tax=Labrys miyagiensis TaxID=346912 RepID=A0ABQ6CPI3_9HYPH|nr:hypothetical protein [Labrys miyagiensis]GLS21683.1 hypothetical protein GCM10007874_47000 [Labrys miyagiensis]
MLLVIRMVRPGLNDSGEWLRSEVWKVTLALNLIPFAGVAFLWFIGVLRHRLGAAEDRLLATVFLGSGLLFVALLFVSASAIGAILVSYAVWPMELPRSSTFLLARSFAYHLTTTFALKMAGVFMLSASTIVLRTRIAPRRTAILGYAAALIILIGSQFMDWTFFAFPLWVLVVSMEILVDEFRNGTSKPT